MQSKLYLFFFAICLYTCVPPPQEDVTLVNVDLNAPGVREVYDLQDQLATDSLVLFLQDENATMRYWAARAFASVQGKEAVSELTPLLKDTTEMVRHMAAYALGQIGSEEAEEALVKSFDAKNPQKSLNFYVLEAIGKSASAKYLPLISSVETYQATDTQLVKGQAYCVYNYMLRGITQPVGTMKMLELVENTSNLTDVRLVAANYLFRGRNLGLDSLANDSTLAEVFIEESDPRIRMALAIALGRTKTDFARETLLAQYDKERDYRVKCNIIRAFSNFDYVTVKVPALTALRSSNLHIANTAVLYLTTYGNSREANSYRRLAKDTTLHPQVQIGLLAAANSKMPSYFVEYKGRINFDLRRIYESVEDPYLKAQALTAMGYFPRMYRYIGELDLSAEAPVVQTAKMEALRLICRDAAFRASMGVSVNRATREIGAYLLKGIEGGDVGQVAIASSALRMPERNFAAILADSISILETALANLEIPKEIEAYNELNQTIAFFKGTDYEETKPDFNHSIDWNIVDRINEEARATIKTTKGDITLRFYKSLAPATVASFVQLAESGYFNGKNFHRVVPNFVIQGGCNRGDGYGAESFSIRSELPPIRYEREGMIGMASAGLHTEGTQFFITHSPALHLNGKYTIFAEVVSGMQVVHDIQVGDKIESVIVETPEVEVDTEI
ncbi:MAG: peptidylprolyl isomerase [Bacteroidota bacterium]